jgi:hypothetical protein
VFRVRAFELCCFLFHDIHIAVNFFLIYNSITESLVLFPFSSSLVLSLCHYIISRLSINVGSSLGRLRYLHLHIYNHTTNPTLLGHGWRVHGFKLCFLLRHVHLALKTSVIYNSNAVLLNSQPSLYYCSQMFQSISRCLPSPLTSCPSGCLTIPSSLLRVFLLILW